ncbi:hypothetical protein [Burkholderia territorii]|uniref:hypothetical protein n=1 Tax=Burkholderia territorii TaxID=1503055 RepID=UPI0012D8706C|nr:hypothetical protein [Burkholderia territorii]
MSFEVAKEETRTKVREALKTFSGYCPINRTCWAILSDKKAAEVRDIVAEGLEAGDRIFVIRSGTAAAWKNSYGEKNTAWLKKNL